LSFADRSVDFGRPETVGVLGTEASRGGLSSLLAIRERLWREGAVALAFPTLKPALFAAIESAHAVRGLAGRGLAGRGLAWRGLAGLRRR